MWGGDAVEPFDSDLDILVYQMGTLAGLTMRDPTPREVFTFENEDYLHVPPEGFRPLAEFPEYREIAEKGLLVARRKLGIDDTVRRTARGIMDLSDQRDGDQLGSISWYQSKELVEKLGGMMLTPALLFCVIRYLRVTGTDDGMLEDITVEDEEWLDGIVEMDWPLLTGPNAQLYTHTKVSPSGYSDGIEHRLWREAAMGKPAAFVWDKSGWAFDLKDVDSHTGLPRELHENGPFYYGNPHSGTWALIRGQRDYEYSTRKDMLLHVWWEPTTSLYDGGVRFCKIPDKEQNL